MLVVDDDADMLATMSDLLELHGAQAETASSGEAARRILSRGFLPSVVVLDLRLGDGERGESFAEWLRSAPSYQEIPVVLMSGDVQALRRVSSAVDSTLTKPFDVDRLYQLLDALCASARRARARREP